MGSVVTHTDMVCLTDVPYQVSKEEVDPKQLPTRAVKKDIFEKQEKFQTGILRKQTVSGHEWKGCAFYSKPSCIHFKVSGCSA